jgi:hypothetical protein
MRRRLLALFVVASISGTVAGSVASATGAPEATGARIPPLPVLREVANLCSVPQLYGRAFRRAAHDTGLVQYIANVTTLWRELRGCR